MRFTDPGKTYDPTVEAEIAARQISYDENRSEAMLQLRGGDGLMGAFLIKIIMGLGFIIPIAAALIFGDDWSDQQCQLALHVGLAVGWIAGTFVARWARSLLLWALHLVFGTVLLVLFM
jgi:hypothetical protein